MKQRMRILVLVLVLLLAAVPTFAQDDTGDDDNDYEIRGVVTEVGDGFIVIGGQTIDISAVTRIDDEALVVGAVAEVEYRVVNGEWVVYEVDDVDASSRDDMDDDRDNDSSRDDDDYTDDYALRGTIEEIGEGYIIIAGQRFDLGTDVDFDDDVALVVGERVEVDFLIDGDTWRVIEVDDIDDWETTYTVRPGDTLSSIAARIGISVDDLADYNDIDDIRFVVVGAQLFVPRPPQFDFDDDDDDDDDDSRRGFGFGDDDNDDDNGSDDNDDDRDDDNGSDDNDDDRDDDNGSDDNDDDNDDDDSDDDNDDDSDDDSDDDGDDD